MGVGYCCVLTSKCGVHSCNKIVVTFIDFLLFPLVPKHVWVCARASSGVFVFLQNSIAFQAA
jgi:hypothetical protein